MALNPIERRQRQGSGFLDTLGKIAGVAGGVVGTLATGGVAAPVLAPVAAGLATGSAATKLMQKEPSAPQGPTLIERRQSSLQKPVDYSTSLPVLEDSLLALKDAPDEVRAQHGPTLIDAYMKARRGLA